MTETNDTSVPHARIRRSMHSESGAASAVYGMGFLGAVVYFIVHAATIWDGVVGVIKAIVWPAMIVYRLMEFLKM